MLFPQFTKNCDLPEDQYLTETDARQLNIHPSLLNSDGSPITVFHGSKSGKELIRSGHFDEERSNPLGFFFTDNEDVAYKYENRPLNSEFQTFRRKLDSTNHEINRIKNQLDDNPKDYYFIKKLRDLKQEQQFDQQMFDYVVERQNEYLLDSDSETVSAHLIIQDPLILDAEKENADIISSVNRARRNNNDAVIIKNFAFPSRNTTYIVFDPSRVVNTENLKRMSQYLGPYEYEKSDTLPEDQYFVDSDKDGLLDGTYIYNYDTKRFIRSSDEVPSLKRFRGIRLPEDKVLNAFTTSYDPVDDDIIEGGRWENREGVFSSHDERVAMSYGYPHTVFDDGSGLQGQVYDITINPTEYVDLGDCEEHNETVEASRLGFDAVDCPEFTAQPETIAFHPEQITIDRVNVIEGDNINYTLSGREIVERGNNPYEYSKGVYRGKQLYPEVTTPEDQYLMINVLGAEERDPEMRRKLKIYNNIPVFDTGINDINLGNDIKSTYISNNTNQKDNIVSRNADRLNNTQKNNLNKLINRKYSNNVFNNQHKNQVILSNNKLFSRRKDYPPFEEFIYLNSNNKIQDKKEHNDRLLKSGVMAQVINNTKAS